MKRAKQRKPTLRQQIRWATNVGYYPPISEEMITTLIQVVKRKRNEPPRKSSTEIYR